MLKTSTPERLVHRVIPLQHGELKNSASREFLIILSILIGLLSLLFSTTARAQVSPCGPATPTFTVNLTSAVNASYISPPVQRQDLCCGAQSPNTCVQFIITLNPLSTGIIFDIYSGAVPPGALFYQINCGPPTPVGSPICLTGPGPHILTFCKPGNNINQFSIQALPDIIIGNDITLNNGCTDTLAVSGYDESTVTWTSVAPGSPGQYNGYLSCQSGCDTVTVTGMPGMPSYIDYQVCGLALGGCSTIPACDTIRVYYNQTLAVNITPVNPTICFGNTGITLTANVTGGAPPYSYSWSNSAATQSVFVGPGTYTVTVNDTTNCPVATASVVVTSFTATITANAGPDQNVCGSPTITLAGSVTGVTTGVWSGGTGTFFPNNTFLNALYTPSPAEIAAGSVTLTLTTTNNGTCPPGTDNVTIFFHQFNATTSTTVNNVTCNGANNGSATATATGGSPPFTYSWNTSPVQNNATATNLAPGTYTCTITDMYGCTGTVAATITQPAVLTTTGSQTNVSCNGGNNGSATVTPSGGTGPYNYFWSPYGGSNATATGLNAQVFTVTVTDANGCTATRTFSITQPAALTATATTNPSTCGNPNGSATVTPAGGIGPYTYVWSPTGGTNATASGLAAGPYTCLVTDANGCQFTASTTITNVAGPTASIPSFSNVSCNGGSNGSATVSLAGGTSPFTYSWSPSGGTNATATGLSATIYVVTVTDANGCTATASVNITQPSPINTLTSVTNVSCFGGCNGSATAAPSGGVGPYTYAWSPGGGTTATVTGRCAGSYTCTVTDANGCPASVSVTITQPTALTTTTSQTNVSCNGGNNGSATVTPAGGIGPYTYSWTPFGGTNATANNLNAQVFTCTVTDANGCTATQTISITQPTAVTAGTSTVSSTCGNPNGTATVFPSGGTGPYTFSWSPTGGPNATASGLMAGPYTCLVMDANGCTFTASVTVTNIAGPTATIPTFSNVSCNGGNNGSATVSLAGGTSPFTYSWSPSGGNNATAINLSAITYVVTVTDANNCTATASISITQPAPLTATQSVTNVSCFAGCNGSATVVPSGGVGPYTYSWAPSGGNAATTTGRCAGTYTCTIFDANSCSISLTAAITQPSQIVLNTAGFPVSCSGSCNGQGVVIPSGGTGSYTYLWQPGSSISAAATNLCAGIYTVTVTDNNNCSASDTAIVVQPSPITLTTGSTPAYCNHPTGTASVNASGGVGNYTYLWQPTNQTSATATGLLPGTYSVTVTDNNGCTSDTVVNVGNTSGQTLTVAGVTPPNCSQSCDGSATVSVSGGNPPYSYTWNTSPQQTSATAVNLCAGTYLVIISDAQGCIDSLPVVMAAPPPLNLIASANPIICAGQSTTLSDSAYGGTPPYIFSWSPGGPIVSPMTTTSYSVTVTDAHGCTAGPVQVVQQVYPPLSAGITGTSQTCQNMQATLTATGLGGNGGPYTYSWMPGNMTGNTITVYPSATTTYTVTVSDNCTTPLATATFTITVPAMPVASFTANDSAGCGQVCVNFTNTTPNLLSSFWTFSDGFTTSTPNPSHCFTSPGSYDATLIATDNNGCVDTVTMPSLINVYANPVADFTFGPQPTTILEPNICFTDRSTPDAVTWYWNFDDPNDATTGNVQNPCHAYSDTGHYCPTLIVTNQYGCFSTATYCLTINPYFTIYVPNAFTPNGDGINDVFLPVAYNIDPTEYELTIYDRWGNLIFKTETWGEGWNGIAKNGNQVAQIDTYVWKISVKDYTGLRHKMIGHVSIIK